MGECRLEIFKLGGRGEKQNGGAVLDGADWNGGAGWEDTWDVSDDQ